MRISLRKCKIGIRGSNGWLVRYGEKLMAVLRQDDDGTVFLAAGLEYPFVNVMVGWDSLDDARAHCDEIGRLYSNGVSPEAIADFLVSEAV